MIRGRLSLVALLIVAMVPPIAQPAVVAAADPSAKSSSKDGGEAGATAAVLAGLSITSPGPLSSITISPDLNCALNHVADTVGEFFGDTACATLLAANGVLYGPAFIPAGGSASPRTAFTPVSQTKTGTGSREPYDPYRITTVVDAGTSGLRITEVDSYVAGDPASTGADGDAFYQTSVTVENASANSMNVVLYRAGDCYLQDSDFGFGRLDTITRAVSCVAARTLSDGSLVPGGRIEEWQPISAGSTYFEGFYDDLWARIGTQQLFPSTSRDNDYIDNGAGLSWGFLVPAGGQETRANRFTITSLGCYQEELVDSVGSPTDQVMVRYDARYLWPENDPNYLARAASMTEAIKARAEATLAQYAALGFPVAALPRPVTIEVRCDPAFFNIFADGRPGLAEAADKIKLQADFLKRTMTPYVTGGSSAIDATEWANLIDHELVHALQLQQAGQFGLGWRTFVQGDYANIEGTATLGQDLLSGVDDAGVSPGSFLAAVRSFLAAPLPIDTSANEPAAYRVAGFYEYLAERFGDSALATLEQRVADMARRLYSGPVRLAGVRDAIGASATDAVFDGLRDFYVTAYVRNAANAESLPLRLRILDEITAYGQPTGTGPQPPSWDNVFVEVPPGSVSPTNAVNIVEPSLDATKGIIYEVPLAPGLSEVRVTVRDHPNGYVALKGSQPPDRLRLGFVPVAAGSVVIDPAFFRTGPLPRTSESYDIPVVGMDKLTIAVVAGRQKGDYELTIEARAGTPGLTMDPVDDVADADQAGGIPVFVVPSVGGIGSRGLPARVFSATVDGASASVTAAFDLQGRYLVFVKPAASLAVGSHAVAVSYGTASASRTVEITSSGGGGGTASLTSLSASGSLRTALALGGAGQAGTPIETSFVLADHGVGLTGATVTATVTDPSGVVRVVPLTDEGSVLDTGWSDGASAVLAYGTDLAGTYTVRVDASGSDSLGVPFAVSQTGAVTVGPKVDGDGDGVADSIEPTFGLSATDPTDGAGDPDLDLVSSSAEIAAGSDPLNPDTDEGGEADGSELAAGRSPLNATDDVSLPPVVVGAVARDGRRFEVSVAAQDGATPIRLYRLSNAVVTDLGLRQGAGETFLDGPLALGTYEYLAVAELASGARSGFLSSGPVEARDDATPPVARITLAGNRPATNQPGVSVQFTDLAEPVVEMRLAETLDSLAAAAWVPYQTETTFALGPGDGLHEVFAQVRDAAGLASPVAQGIIELDTASPTSSVGVLPSSTIMASIDVPFTSDDGTGSGVDTVELWVRSRANSGAPWGAWALAAAASSSPITYAFPDYGEFEFYTTALDLAGNRELAPSSADASIRYQVADTTPPTSAAGPLGAVYASNAVAVPYTATDGASGVASVELWVRYRRNEAQAWAPYAMALAGTSSPFTYTFANGDGNYEFYTIAVDNVGNREVAPAVADAATRRDAVDDLPDVTFNASAWKYSSTAPINLTGAGTAADDRNPVVVTWQLYGVKANGQRQRQFSFKPAAANDGAFDSRIEMFRLQDQRSGNWVWYDIDVKVTAGSQSVTRTVRIVINVCTPDICIIARQAP